MSKVLERKLAGATHDEIIVAKCLAYMAAEKKGVEFPASYANELHGFFIDRAHDLLELVQSEDQGDTA